MSSRSPHHHPHTRKEHELDALISKNPALRAHLARTPRIDETKDVPDTAGYSKIAGTVYIDRHLARAAPEIDGKPYSEWKRALVDHEWFEKGAIDILGETYDGAHEWASMYENRTVAKIGMKPFKYNKGLAPYIKRDLLEKIMVPPRDLDCSPYEGPHQTPTDKRIMARLAKLKVDDAAPSVPAPAPTPIQERVENSGDLKALRVDIAGMVSAIDRLCVSVTKFCEEKQKMPPVHVHVPPPKKTRRLVKLGYTKSGHMAATTEDDVSDTVLS